MRLQKDFDEKEYRKKKGHTIHPDFYSFDGHAPEYVIATAYDDCGLPLTKKSSLGESLSLKIKATKDVPLSLSITTDGEKTSRQSIKALPRERKDSVKANPTCIINVAERVHGWVEKQIIIEGNSFCSPFGLCSLAFKYLQNEKIKKG